MTDNAHLASYTIGGVTQWLLYSERPSSKPVLLFLHGGPGLPLFPMRRTIAERTALEELFTVAYWEQRGTGKSYSRDIPPASMSIEQFVSDTVEVAELARGELGADKLVLFGHSWGSIIGTITARRRPDLFHAYIGVGQIVDMMRGEQMSYQWARQRAEELDHTKAQRELDHIGAPPHSVKHHLTERRWVQEFGGGRRDESAGVMRTLFEALRTPQYSLLDVLRMAQHPLFSLDHLLEEMYEINFFEQAPELELPVHFVEGRHDQTIPTVLVERYFEMLEAPAKYLHWFEDSAHYPFLEEPERFDELMREISRGPA